MQALRTARDLGLPPVVIGGGTNLIVSDAGFGGVVLRYTGSHLARDGMILRVEAGAILQDVVDQSIGLGFKGLETLNRDPGISRRAPSTAMPAPTVTRLRSWLKACASATVSASPRLIRMNASFDIARACSRFAKNGSLCPPISGFQEQGDPIELTKTAHEIRAIRDAKYPPQMRCAGSIFENLLFAELPARVQTVLPANIIREGKVPSAWFLEQTGAKGMRRGDIQVAPYHANLVYNDGPAWPADLVSIIQELKQRVHDRFGFDLEEEVQYVGFEYAPALT